MPGPKGQLFYLEEEAAKIWIDKKPEDGTWKSLIPVYNKIRQMIKDEDRHLDRPVLGQSSTAAQCQDNAVMKWLSNTSRR